MSTLRSSGGSSKDLASPTPHKVEDTVESTLPTDIYLCLSSWATATKNNWLIYTRLYICVVMVRLISKALPCRFFKLCQGPRNNNATSF